MNIISVNIAQQESLHTPNGLVQTGIIKKPVTGPIQVTELGLAGDAIVDTKVHGGLDQALYLYSQVDYDWWSQRLGKQLAPGIFGENLTVSSFGAQALRVGDQLQINNVIIEISAPRTPCFKLATRMGSASFIKDFIQAARTGAYARVIQTGVIAQGDSIALIKTHADYPEVDDVFKACHAKTPDMHTVHSALASPLGVHHKKIIQAIADRQASQ